MDANRILNGSNGQVWVNGELWGEVKSIDFKITGDFQDVNVVGTQGTQHKYTGWTGEGTLTLLKAYSRGTKAIANGFKTGNIPEFTINTKATDKTTGASERWVLDEVIFKELGQKIEAKNLMEQEMPFVFSDYDLPETIEA